MTHDPTTNPSPAQMPVKASESPAEASDMSSLPRWAQTMVKDLRSEAGRHRTRLREVEAERDTLKGDLTDMRRTVALAAVTDILDDPADLERFTNLDELVDDTGTPDPARYADAARALVGERPRLAPAPSPPPSSGADADSSAQYSAPSKPPVDAGAAMLGILHDS